MTCEETFLDYKILDTLPAIACTYKQRDSVTGEKVPVDISGYTFYLDINYNTPERVTGSIVGDPTNGEFIFNFTVGSSEIKEVGKWNTEIVIIDASGNPLTYEFVKFNIKQRILSPP